MNRQSYKLKIRFESVIFGAAVIFMVVCFSISQRNVNWVGQDSRIHLAADISALENNTLIPALQYQLLIKKNYYELRVKTADVELTAFGSVRWSGRDIELSVVSGKLSGDIREVDEVLALHLLRSQIPGQTIFLTREQYGWRLNETLLLLTERAI